MPARVRLTRGRLAAPPVSRLEFVWLEDRVLPSAAFDITGLTALRADPAYADVDGRLPGQFQNIGVAVLDTGGFGNHPDLRANVKAYYDAVANKDINGPVLTDPAAMTPDMDPNGHGSHVAGTIASSNPEIGVATKADLVIVRALLGPADRNVFHNPVVNGLNWVAANQQKYNIRVVNMSLGSGGNFNNPSEIEATAQRVAEAQAIARLEALGVTVVTATGNSYAEYGAAGAAYPAAVSTVSVANLWEDDGRGDEFPFGRGGGNDRFFAVDADAVPGRLASSSQRSELPNQVAAPGSSIFSVWNGATGADGRPKLYATIDGTSMASPFVAGVVALMQDAAVTSAGRYLQPAEVLSILRGTADKFTDTAFGSNFKFDSGTNQQVDLPETGATFYRVNVTKAVAAARGQVGGGGGGGGTTGADTNLTREKATPVPNLDGNRVYTFEGSVGKDGETTVGPGDVDLYKVEVQSPGSLNLLLAPDDGGKGFDPYLRVFNAGGSELAANDNFEGDLYSFASVPVQPGTYYVGVSSGPNTSYSIRTGGGVRAGASTGDFVLLALLSNPDPNGVFTGAVDFPYDDGIFPVFDPDFVFPTDFEQGVEVDPGKAGYVVTGRIGSDPPPTDDPNGQRLQVGAGDVDMFKYVVPDDGRLYVRVASYGNLYNPFDIPFDDPDFLFNNPDFQPFDTFLRVFDANGNPLGSNEDGSYETFTDSGIEIRGLTRGQTIYLAVSNSENQIYDPRDPYNRTGFGLGGYYELVTVFDNGDLNGTAFSAVELPTIGEPAGGTIGTDFVTSEVGADGKLDVDFLRITAPQAGVLKVTATGVDGFRPSVTVWGFAFDEFKNPVALTKIATTNTDKAVVLAPVEAGQTYYVSFTGQGNGGFTWSDVAGGTGGETGDYTVATELLAPDAGKDIQDKGIDGGAPPKLLTLNTAVVGNTGRDSDTTGTEYVVAAPAAGGGLAYGQGDIDTYKFVAPASGRVAFRVYGRAGLGGASDPVLRVFDAAGTELGMNDDINDRTRDAEIVLDVVAGKTYFLGVTGSSAQAAKYNILSGDGPAALATGQTGPYTVVVADLTPPKISNVPDQKAVPAGTRVGPVAFTVGDLGTPAGQLKVTAASNNTALVPNANIVIGGTGGNRTVTVTPAAGMSGTATITLTVRDADGRTATDRFTVTFSAPPDSPPTVTNIGNPAAVTVGTRIGPITFTVGDAQTAAGSLVVTARSGNTDLVPNGNIQIAGTGANRTVTITPAAGQTGTAVITLTVRDADGRTATDTFTVTVTDSPTNTAPTISNVPDQAAVVGGTRVGPINFTVSDKQTTAGSLVVTARSNNTDLVPDGNIVIGGSGANRTVTITPAAGRTGTATITLTVRDADGRTVADTFTVTFTGTPGGGGGPRPVLVGFPQFAVGADVGGAGATLFNPDRGTRYTVEPFGGFTGGVRTAAADFNGDGVADLIVGPGPGRATRVVVLDGKTQAQLFAVDPFEASFTGGVYVTAGDLNGDGVPELVITPDEGGGPRCRVFDGAGLAAGTESVTADFFGIDDPNFRGGARAAVGDVNGDGVGDLVVAAGFQGGPRVAGYNGRTLGSARPATVFPDFFAFEETLRNGVYVAVGDVDGDGRAEVIAGGGPGGGPRVTAFSGSGLLASQFNPVANFFGGNPDSRGGIRVAVKNLDGDARADVVVGAGTGAGNRATAYYGKDIGPGGTPPAAFDFDAIGGFAGGVFVG